METRFIQTFLTVAETGSVAEAARRMNITPSAVTQRVRALEGEVGQSLVQRSGQRMELTSFGAGILAQSRQMVRLAEDIRTVTDADGTTGYLRIGVIQSALTGILPDVLVRLRGSHPGIELYLVPGSSGDLYAQLAEGELDLALIVQPHFTLPKSLEWKRLRSEALLFITPLGMGHMEMQTVLKHEPFIRYDRNHWGGRAVDQYLRQARLRPKEHYELDSLEAIVVMVSRGLGVSIIPDWPGPWPADAQVDRIAIAGAPCREVGFLWSRTSRRQSLIRAIIEETQSPHR
jgi:DNA-binding transcriptional LysR family regulator